MKLRTAWLRFWGTALLVGIAAAVVAAFGELMPLTRTSPFEENNYFGHRLYATGLHLLLQAMHRWLPPLLGLALLLAAALRLGALGRGKARPWLRIGVPLLTLLALLLALLLWAARSYPTRWYLAQIALKHGLQSSWQSLVHSPFTLLLPLAGLLWVHWRLRRARRSAAARPLLPLRPLRRLAMAVAVLLQRLAMAVVALLVLLGVGLHGWAGLLHLQTRQALRGKPNIIFIMVDTLRADHLGCYGYDLPTTPHIDRLAGESTRFAFAIAPSSWTVWSVHALFTAHHPDVIFGGHAAALHTRGVALQPGRFGTGAAPLRYATLAEVLRDRGYGTHAITSNPWLGNFPDNAQGYDWYDDAASKLNAECACTAPHVTRTAIARVAQIKDQDAPFFLFVQYMDPHAPYEQHAEFVFADSPRDLQKGAALPAAVTDAQRRERQQLLRRYNSEIAYTDHAVGELLDNLRHQGLYDDALIVFFSDHGEEFREHGDLEHLTTVYQEVIQVPLLIKWPRQQEGTVVPGAFALLDLYPSLVAHLGFAAPPGLQGQAWPLAQLLRADRPVFSATSTTMRCVIDGQWKYIRQEQPALEQCFDLAADPLEQHNLLGPDAPEAAARLRAAFDAWDAQNVLLQIKYAGTPAEQQRLRAIDPRDLPSSDLLKQLQTLGYLQ